MARRVVSLSDDPVGTPHHAATCCWCKAPLVIGEVIDKRCWLCPVHWKRQSDLAFVVTKKGGQATCLNVPLPSQAAFEECQAKNILWGGQAGPGKSHGARWWLYKRALTIPGHEALLTRENWEQLEKTHIRKMGCELPLMGARLVDREARFPNGSFIDCGHMADAEAVTRYLSTEYNAIVSDEASQTPVNTEGITPLGELSTRARKVSKDIKGVVVRPRFMPVSNPGGPSASWLRDMFIDHLPDYDTYPALRPVCDPETGEQTKGYRPEQWAYIPATLADNPYQDDEYEDTLSVLTAVRHKQLAEGDWRVFAGQFFQQWHESRHVRDLGTPSGVRWFRSLDWGYNQPGCVLWWAVLPDSRLYIRAELKFQQMDEPDVVKAVKKIDQQLRIQKVDYTAADPAVFNKTGATHRAASGFVGLSIGQTLGYYGMPLVGADNDRINGWKRCHALLRTAPDGFPWLAVHPDNRYFIRTIASSMSDKTNADDLNTKGDDHACLTGDTRILTRTGWKPLATMGLTDTVWTREGWKPVEAVAMTERAAALRRVTCSDGTVLIGTDNHPVWTEKHGWVRMDALRYDDILTVCHESTGALNPSCTAGSRFAAIRTRLGLKIAATTSRMAATFSAAWKPFIAKSGKTPTGRFLTAGIFITQTAKRVITPSRISSGFRGLTIWLGTWSGVSTTWTTWTGFAHWPLNGTPPMPDVTGIPPMRNTRGWTDSRFGSPAISVAWPSRTSRDERTRDSAPTTASPHGAGLRMSMTSTASAMSVTPCSASIATAEAVAAPVPVVRVVASSPAGIGTVYNLTVQDCHEYYANGVLVSNCDAFRYGAMSPAAPQVGKMPVVKAPEGSPRYYMDQMRQKSARLFGRVA